MRFVLISALALALLAPAVAHAQQLTLDGAIRMALARNERAKIAAAKIETAEAGVVKARSEFLPTVQVSASETLRPYTVEQNGRTTVRSNQASASLQITQPLVNVTAFPGYAAAKHDREAARFEAKNDRRALAFETARAFFQVLAQQQVLEAAQRRLERAEASLTATRAQAAAQITGSNDVTRGEIERAGAARSVALAQGNLERTKIDLSFLIDAPVTGELKAPDRAVTIPAARRPDDLVARAVPERPDVAATRESAAAANAAADEPGLRFAPRLDLVGQARVNDQPGQGDRYTDYTLTLGLSWTIWDGGSRGADSDSRRAAANVAELQAQAQRRRVGTEVRGALVSLDTAQKALAIADQIAASTRRGAEESAVLYREGLARAIELMDANLARFEAEVDLAQARFDLAQAQLELRSAMGLFPTDDLR